MNAALEIATRIAAIDLSAERADLERIKAEEAEINAAIERAHDRRAEINAEIAKENFHEGRGAEVAGKLLREEDLRLAGPPVADLRDELDKLGAGVRHLRHQQGDLARKRHDVTDRIRTRVGEETAVQQQKLRAEVCEKVADLTRIYAEVSALDDIFRLAGVVNLREGLSRPLRKLVESGLALNRAERPMDLFNAVDKAAATELLGGSIAKVIPIF